MEPSEIIKPGMAREEIFEVKEEHSASHVGSGSLRVLATPWMVAYMESVARALLGEHLPEGASSVGAHLDVHHLAPTPIGQKARVRAEVLVVDGAKVSFSVQAWDEVEQVGDGRHLRVIIDEVRFLRRVEKKQEIAKKKESGE
jgi:fluoroacetyl-CoA thioesterase